MFELFQCEDAEDKNTLTGINKIHVKYDEMMNYLRKYLGNRQI